MCLSQLLTFYADTSIAGTDTSTDADTAISAPPTAAEKDDASNDESLPPKPDIELICAIC